MRVIRIREVPAIERALARFDVWWDGLSRRERVMVSVLGALLGAVLVVYGVVKPIQGARAQALADIRTYETLNARIRAAGKLGAQPAMPAVAMRTGAPGDIVTGAATSAGLVATVQPNGGGVRATVADGGYDQVLTWLGDLGRSSRLRVAQVEIVRSATPGRVRAQVDFVQ